MSEHRNRAELSQGGERPVMAAVLQPCDAGVIRGTRTSAPCRPSSRPWVIAAASLGSGMAFLDSTVVNVALPAVQTDLGASARGTQWVYGAYALVLAAALLVGDRSVQSASREPSRLTGVGRKAPILRTASQEEVAMREGRAPQPVTVKPT
jgi:hypothetical protein